jgi:hypothetical protein
MRQVSGSGFRGVGELHCNWLGPGYGRCEVGLRDSRSERGEIGVSNRCSMSPLYEAAQAFYD